MKRLSTTLCCIAFAIIGVCIASVGNKDRPNSYNTISASTLPVIPANGILPIDLKLSDSLKNKKDTVIIRDTVRVTNKPKKVRVPYMVTKYDTVYQNILFIVIPEVREEKTSKVNDSINNATFKNVNHSTSTGGEL